MFVKTQYFTQNTVNAHLRIIIIKLCSILIKFFKKKLKIKTC